MGHADRQVLTTIYLHALAPAAAAASASIERVLLGERVPVIEQRRPA